MSMPTPAAGPNAAQPVDWQAVIEDLNSDLVTAALLERSVLRVHLRAAEARVAELEQAVRDASAQPVPTA